MLDSLGALVITFFVMSFISVAGVVLMHLVKNEKVKKGFFYFLSVWGIVVAWCNAQGIYSIFDIDNLFGWILGSLSIVALLIQTFSKKENKFKIASILVTISVVVGMMDCFMFL